MRTLYKKDIENILTGATILGAGGGGSLENGLGMLEKYIENNPNKEISLKMIEVDEVDESKLAAVAAGIGSPLAVKEKDFTPYALNAFNYLKEYLLDSDKPKEISYTLPVELGGFTSFIPMLVSMVEDIPLIDGDGAGRAVPALETLLLNVNGCDTSPCCLADDKDNRILLTLVEKNNAALAEVLSRNVCMAFDMVAGLSGWVLTKEELKKCIPSGSLSLCERIGKLINEEDLGNGTIFDKLDNAKTICTGEIIDITTEMKNGFDVGKTIVKADDGNIWEIDVINENLILRKQGESTPYITAPDIITFYEKDTNKVLTNADTHIGQKVVLGIIKSLDEWFYTSEDHVTACWKKYFETCGYTGKVVRYKDGG